MSLEKPNTEKLEFVAVIQNIHRRKKGSKACKDPHTAITVLTREISEKEMDALVHGGCFGNRVCLKIEVVKK